MNTNAFPNTFPLTFALFILCMFNFFISDVTNIRVRSRIFYGFFTKCLFSLLYNHCFNSCVLVFEPSMTNLTTVDWLFLILRLPTVKIRSKSMRPSKLAVKIEPYYGAKLKTQDWHASIDSRYSHPDTYSQVPNNLYSLHLYSSPFLAGLGNLLQ